MSFFFLSDGDLLRTVAHRVKYLFPVTVELKTFKFFATSSDIHTQCVCTAYLFDDAIVERAAGYEVQHHVVVVWIVLIKLVDANHVRVL